MELRMLFYFPIGFEGDEGTKGEDGTAATKTYTQEEFDKHMGGLRKKHEATQKQLADQLKAAREQPGLADEEREALQKQIEGLEATYMTKQQLAEKAAQKKETALQDQIKELTDKGSQWKNNFESEVVRNQIYLESNKHEAHDPEAMSRMLGPDITWKEIEGDNGTTYEPRVAFADVDKEGKPVTLELTIGQAMARMKELPDRFGFLFKGQQKAGIGGIANTGTAGGQQLTQAMLAKNPALLRKIMKEQPELLKDIK
jgi:hypothetical protein